MVNDGVIIMIDVKVEEIIANKVLANILDKINLEYPEACERWIRKWLKKHGTVVSHEAPPLPEGEDDGKEKH